MALPKPPPPVVSTGPKNEKAKYFAWAKKNGLDRKVAADAYYWSGVYKLDPYFYAATLIAESGGHQTRPDGSVVSSGQASGIGQIAPVHIGEPVPWDKTKKITAKDIASYGFNIRWSAYYLSEQVQKYGYDNAYTQGYNPADPNRYKADARIKAMIPKDRALSPSQGVGQAPAPGQSPTGSTEWAVVGKQGVVSFVTGTTPPKNVLRDIGGVPVDRNGFFQQLRSLNDIYVPYTGRAATYGDVVNYFRKPTSQYQLQQTLAGRPGFTNSPLWKTQAPGYEAVWHKIYGDQSQPDQKLLTYAIVHNLGSEGFANEIRKAPSYLGSNEFKSAATSFQGVYEQIFGRPDQKGLNTIREAAYQGWSPDQFAAYLRSQPEYTSTPEYETKSLAFLGELGLITGGTPVLTKGNAPVNTARPGQAPQDTKLVPGAPGLSKPNEYVASYGK